MNSVLAIIVLLSVLLIGYFYYVSQSISDGNIIPDHHSDSPDNSDNSDSPDSPDNPDNQPPQKNTGCTTNTECYPTTCDTNGSKKCFVGSDLILYIIQLQASIADYCETIDILERVSSNMFSNFESGLNEIKVHLSNNKNHFYPLDITDQKKKFQDNLDKLKALNYCDSFIKSTLLTIYSTRTDVQNKLANISQIITAVNIDPIREEMGNLLSPMYSYPFNFIDHLYSLNVLPPIPHFSKYDGSFIYTYLTEMGGSMLTISQLLNDSHDKFYMIMQRAHDAYSYVSHTYMG